uniref:Acyl-CoA thioesterase II domain-containing protein n=1 Tax=Acrobeloides nanus TaxID=290746 RepID=A0A914EPQ4_9BILA
EGSASNFTVTPKFPNVPPPEALKDAVVLRKEALANGVHPKKLRAFNTERIAPRCEVRACDEDVYLRGSDGRTLKQYIWMRYQDPVDCADLSMIHSTLAYVSDLHLVMTGMLPYPHIEFKLHTSLDHSAWYHEFRFDVNEWILYEQECVAHSANRSLIHGRIWSRSGRLLMSTSQEGLIYPASKPLEKQKEVNVQGEKLNSKI